MNAPRPPLLTLDEALPGLLARAVPLSGVQEVDLHDADGRVLAQDLVAPLQVPPHDNSSMDGYALRCADVPRPGVFLKVTQRIPAGSQGRALSPGEAARIFTGAPIPPCADAVVMQEDTEALADDLVRVNVLPSDGQWIRRSGEDITRGRTVLSSGARLGPAELGLAASLGLARLSVMRRPRVALFSTGDELVMPGTTPPEDMPPGAIYNSNRFFLRALLLRLGCEVTDLGIVPDRREATVQALTDAASRHDLILTSGGVSVGEEDHIKPAIESLGELHLWSLAIKPGKPFAFGSVRRSSEDGSAHFMGLPGNPVSSYVTFLLLVRPFLLRLQGVEQIDPIRQPMRADFDVSKPDRRREFLRVRRNAQGGLDLFPNQSSGVLTSLVWGDGLVDHPAGTTIAKGDMVQFISLADGLS
ncbi:MAG: molybdopterin molybdotransferase MoeA [Alphaproteobacteria bacterium]|nr:molybdopterin molybdotransferase MoeA [Alphaproteobacteria bacterium]